jgi:hypothetical protein
LTGVRVLTVPGSIGIWFAASALGGPVVLTAACTLGAALLALWAIAVLREA